MNDEEKLKQYEEGMIFLNQSLDIQKADGNWNFNAYMLGFANGMILAKAFMTGEEPEFMNQPDRWLEDDFDLKDKVETHDV